LSEIAATLVELTRKQASQVFVNDRVDVALAVGATGIHLPSSGLRIQLVRNIAGPELLIGRSTHSAKEALAAYEQGADYVFLGPIWPTASHPGAPGIGVGAITEVREVPVIAIGGVTPDRAMEAADAGAHGVAAISYLWGASDPDTAAERILLSLHT
jgi:thiamine-phosphate pyrophosphorylase